jgi:hypothetical protein
VEKILGLKVFAADEISRSEPTTKEVPQEIDNDTYETREKRRYRRNVFTESS